MLYGYRYVNTRADKEQQWKIAKVVNQKRRKAVGKTVKCTLDSYFII